MQLDDPLTAALRGLLDVIERWHRAMFKALFTLYAKAALGGRNVRRCEPVLRAVATTATAVRGTHCQPRVVLRTC
jgi:hypothetical protein